MDLDDTLTRLEVGFMDLDEAYTGLDVHFMNLDGIFTGPEVDFIDIDGTLRVWKLVVMNLGSFLCFPTLIVWT